MDQQLDPCIVFSFSKKDCETYALQMSRLDFNDEEEKELVEQVFVNAIEALSDDDRKLPQVETLLPLLKRGVGIHHGGLLPILKEVIEILFQEGLIKCLFATETFSIGINMPAKTVVFTNTRKFDGEDFRWITSGEYIQMSGRAGRRGKDDRGIVIQMLDEKMEPDVAKGMLYGDPDPLFSSYHLSYNMVLNMLRVEDADPEHILRASFHQYQQEQSAPELERQAEELQRSASAIEVREEGVVSEYHTWAKQLERVQQEMMAVILKPQYCLPFFQPGRVVRVRVPMARVSLADGAVMTDSVLQEWGWGVVVNCRKSEANTASAPTTSDFVENVLGLAENQKCSHVLDVLLEIDTGDVKAEGEQDDSGSAPVGAPKGMRPGANAPSSDFLVVQVALHCVAGISAVRLNLAKDLRRPAGRQNTHKALKEVKRRFDAGASIPVLDPVADLGVRDEVFMELSGRASELRNRLASSRFHKLGEDKVEQLENFEKKMLLLEEARKYR
jgi:ATP-dependent RNA helicase DOB1